METYIGHTKEDFNPAMTTIPTLKLSKMMTTNFDAFDTQRHLSTEDALHLNGALK